MFDAVFHLSQLRRKVVKCSKKMFLKQGGIALPVTRARATPGVPGAGFFRVSVYLTGIHFLTPNPQELQWLLLPREKSFQGKFPRGKIRGSRGFPSLGEMSLANKKRRVQEALISEPGAEKVDFARDRPWAELAVLRASPLQLPPSLVPSFQIE